MIKLNGPAVYTNLSVTTAQEVKVGASIMVGRIMVTIQPQNNDIYYGYDTSVTPSTGTLIFKRQLIAIECGSQPIYIISANGSSTDVRITEVG